ncbi:MAG: hypothetical protein HY717_04380 [Planctomycetes bacterium]|nr:hypothetical protein [Planctomycetota bacterium]
MVTTTLGNEGSVVTSGESFLAHATAAQVDPVTSTGAGDTHATTASLSALTGASDRLNCLRGNIDAARLVAGKPLAASLAELDDEIATHPEMVVTVIPI